MTDIQEVEIELGDFTGKAERLKMMEFTTKKALRIRPNQKPNVYRNAISRLHNESDMRFKTRKDGEDLLIWRIA